MPQPLDFSNQNLRDRSFKGRDLAGANFQNADIRGCDFSEANLEGTDFSGVTAGQSGKQIFIATAIAIAGVGAGVGAGALAGAFVVEFAIAMLFAGAGAGALAGALAFAVLVAVLVAFAIAGTVAVLVLVAILVANAVLVAVAVAVMELGKGNIAGGIGYSLVALFLLYLSYILLMQTIERIRNMIGTSFKRTNLTESKFVGAILENCDFTDACLHRVKWTHAHFTRCKLPSNLDG